MTGAADNLRSLKLERGVCSFKNQRDMPSSKKPTEAPSWVWLDASIEQSEMTAPFTLGPFRQQGRHR